MTAFFEARERRVQVPPPRTLLALGDQLATWVSLVVLGVMLAAQVNQNATKINAATPSSPSASQWAGGERETIAAGYVGAPFYYPSDVHLKRPNGTDMTLLRMGWNGDPLYFPIDGGGRVVRWNGTFGTMVDFVHNKAVARLGKGAHGRKIKNAEVEAVATSGTLKGGAAPSPLLLTDLLQRLEFTHGYNTLLLTGMARLAPLTLNIRPYIGLGVGVALPHVEVAFKGEKNWTNEYQYAGPALQLVAGIELRSGRGSYFIEYKFIASTLDVALTNGRSWSLQDLDIPWLPKWLIEPFVGLTEMPGDLIRQFRRAQSGEPPEDGTISTRLSTHEIVVGAGYVWPGPMAAPAAGP